MKRTTIIYLVILVLVGVLAAVALLNRKSGTIPEKETDFAVKDTAAITRIELTGKTGDTSILVRKGPGHWRLNDRYDADQTKLSDLLETIKLVEIKGPVPIPARQNVINSMATEAVKVKIYKGDEVAKSYYVGNPTPDQEGTLMYLEHAADPFVTHIPGFDGYLTTRYPAAPVEWRSHAIYNLEPASIQEIAIDYPDTMPASFRLKVGADGFHMESPSGRPAVTLSDIVGKKLLVGFKKINFEDFVPFYPKERDSLLAMKPYAVIHVKTDQGELPVLRVFRKKADKRTKLVLPGNMDGDKFYGQSGEKSNDIFLLQRDMLASIMASYDALNKVSQAVHP